MNRMILIVAPLMLVLGLAGGYWLARVDRAEVHRNLPMEKSGERKILFYRSPMDPSVTSPVPAKDAMGMDYVPVYSDDGSSDEPAGTVNIDAAVVQQIAVRTAKVLRSTLFHTVRAVGRVTYDEELMVHLHPKIEGWIEHLYVDKTGQWVQKDTDLLSIYSPQLVASQQEYLLALNNLKVLEKSPIEDIRRGAEELVRSSRERLRLLDVPAHQIHELERARKIRKSLHIHAPASGIVMKIGAREGQYVTPATEIYMIADLHRVWVYADVYEYELPWVKENDPVKMRLAGIPGKVFKGHVAYIYPYAEAKTRTIKVRLIFENPELLLKPEMFAEVTIYASKQVNAIVIPSEAIIRSGTRAQVFVVRGPGKFEPRQVELGMFSNGKVAVLKGLNEGEEVVTSAQFLIDSESKLREATAKMMEPTGSMQKPAMRKQGEMQHDE